ncbi:hypothetical protein HG530_012152 [Fusarium avenaceum]|nr:hypothetical protein HG530_012152 [Fusarium avenaceum]
MSPGLNHVADLFQNLVNFLLLICPLRTQSLFERWIDDRFIPAIKRFLDSLFVDIKGILLVILLLIVSTTIVFDLDHVLEMPVT